MGVGETSLGRKYTVIIICCVCWYACRVVSAKKIPAVRECGRAG